MLKSCLGLNPQSFSTLNTQLVDSHSMTCMSPELPPPWNVYKLFCPCTSIHICDMLTTWKKRKEKPNCFQLTEISAWKQFSPTTGEKASGCLQSQCNHHHKTSSVFSYINDFILVLMWINCMMKGGEAISYSALFSLPLIQFLHSYPWTKFPPLTDARLLRWRSNANCNNMPT